MSNTPTIEQLVKEIDDMKVYIVRLHDLIDANKREDDNRFDDLHLALTPIAAKTIPNLVNTLCDVDDIIGKPDRTAPERFTLPPTIDFIKLATSKSTK